MAARQEGQMLHLGDNRWRLRVYLGEVGGKRRYVSKTITGTTAQARQAIRSMHNKVDDHTMALPSKTTVSDFLASWLDSKIDVTPASLASYRWRMKTVTDSFGSTKISALTQSRVQQLVNDMVAQEYSPRAVAYTITVLKLALKRAVKDRLIAVNPAADITLPRRKKRAPSILTVQQVNALLSTTKDNRMNVLWRLLLTSGLRPQEALALRWADVDLEQHWLRVSRKLENNGKGQYQISEETKTGNGRQIGLPESTIDALRAHKIKQNSDILSAGAQYERQGLIFAGPRGEFLPPPVVNKRWKTALKQAGLPTEIRLYDTRHTHLTSLLANGADIAWVASRAGHADVKMTIDHYAHVMPEVHRKMGELTEKIMREAQG